MQQRNLGGTKELFSQHKKCVNSYSNRDLIDLIKLHNVIYIRIKDN